MMIQKIKKNLKKIEEEIEADVFLSETPILTKFKLLSSSFEEYSIEEDPIYLVSQSEELDEYITNVQEYIKYLLEKNIWEDYFTLMKKVLSHIIVYKTEKDYEYLNVKKNKSEDEPEEVPEDE